MMPAARVHPPVQRVLLDHCAAQPWRNGGGVTRELLAWSAPELQAPNDAAWCLRLSVADITQDGPFSSYPGIDRCFAVLEGNGVELTLPQGPRQQRVADPPLAFEGEPATGCVLLNGPTRDLNLMGRRNAGRIVMQNAAPQSTLEPHARWRGFFCFGQAKVDCGGVLGLQGLTPGTLLWTDQPSTQSWRLIEGSRAFWLAFFAREPSS
jgi:environmental stress-induced protein Ves